MSDDKLIRISEIFGPTIQGEGALIGQSTVFVRTGGCDYRCSWCDTLHAVDSKFRYNWTPMTAEEIFEEVQTLSGRKPLTISLSGGNPAIQPLKPLIELAHQYNYRCALETQGSVAQDWFCDLDVLILSPKPPSSAMETDFDKLRECLDKASQGTDIIIKIVVFDMDDYMYAQRTAEQFPHLPLYLQPCNHTPNEDQVIDMNGIMERMRWLIEQTHKDQWFEPIILPQLHTIIWGNQRGV